VRIAEVAAGQGFIHVATLPRHPPRTQIPARRADRGAAPGGIICLLSALRVHDIGTQAPHEVWLALDRKARKPAHPPARIRIVRFSGAMLSYGILTCQILGVPVRLTSPARTVVDCLRYRGKLGLDVALEAMREAIRSRIATADEIIRAADVCRARTVVSTYLETLAS
jgi:predicted transcriptional regulator of viral defense system